MWEIIQVIYMKTDYKRILLDCICNYLVCIQLFVLFPCDCARAVAQ
jgi:hypothetical protein